MERASHYLSYELVDSKIKSKAKYFRFTFIIV